MEILVGDILEMKKAHPCGEKRWLVERTRCRFSPQMPGLRP